MTEKFKAMKPYILGSLEKDVAKSFEPLRTGYKELDRLMRIPRDALTMVAARPAHGKTTFLLNLCLNMARAYPDYSFFFFSFLESKRQIALKLLTIIGETVLAEDNNVMGVERYIKEKLTGHIKLDKGKEEFRLLTESERLWIIDEPLRLEDLLDAISFFAGRCKVGAVFIDYLQKIHPRDGAAASREAELQKVSQRLAEAARSLSIPVVLGAQLRWDERKVLRLDNFYEVSDAVQDASLVLGLYNHVMENAQIMGEIVTGKAVGLKATVLKNRDGMVNHSVDLTLEMPILKIREKAG